MKVLVTGGTGFVGRGVVPAILDRGHEVYATLRAESYSNRLDLDRIPNDRLRVLDIAEPDAWDRAFDVKYDAVVHLVGILKENPKRGIRHDNVVGEATERVVKFSKQTGVRKIVYLSAAGTRANAPSRYHQGKWRAEEAIRGSGLAWTILRPSVIFGPDDNPDVKKPIEFVTELVRVFRETPMICPVLGPGTNKLQPVWRGDVATAVVRALDSPKTESKVFELGGPKVYTFDECVDLIRAKAGITKKKMHLPWAIANLVAGSKEKKDPPEITRDQIVMLREDNVCDVKPYLDAFPETKLKSFEDGLKEYTRF